MAKGRQTHGLVASPAIADDTGHQGKAGSISALARSQGKKTGKLSMPYASQMELVDREASEERWHHPAEEVEQDNDLSRIMDLADKLTKVLTWVADGSAGDTMDLRSWAMLYVLRPDLIKGESMRGFAKRRGLSWSRVNALVREFRALFPGVRFTPASRAGQHDDDERPACPPEGISLKRPSK